jgi:hypothetical protein
MRDEIREISHQKPWFIPGLHFIVSGDRPYSGYAARLLPQVKRGELLEVP